ncbi:unnamed protein product [Schistosoma curassoni]|uniref:DDE_Tnp_ISL3 domain-containing protein n=1 Tax=Schistosoma curassoni TaxID=6186 RepID=A0A183JZG0_9TREM|nr:unnamed protein product [Schistosoma curassoni]
MLLYSDHEDENVPHAQRVAVMSSKEARNTLVVWESHGSRIMKAPLETKKEGITMNVIQCYAPKNDSNDDNKDQFYDRLQSIVAKCSSLCINRPQHTQSIIDEQGGSYANLKTTIGKARTTFPQLWTTWNSKQLSTSQHQIRNLQYERQDSQFYCTELKHGELPQPSSKMYMYL